MRRRRKKIGEEAVDLLLDVVDSIWQVGVVATTIMTGVTIFLFIWASRLNATSEYTSFVTEALVGKYGNLLYLLPAITLLLTLVLANRTYASYSENRWL